MQIIPNQSEKPFVSRLIENSQKSIRPNPKRSFQSRSIRNNPSSDWSIPNFQSESIRTNPRSEWFGLIRIYLDWKIGFGLGRIHSAWCIGINRIKSDWFLTVFDQTRYKTSVGLVRNEFQSDTFARAANQKTFNLSSR